MKKLFIAIPAYDGKISITTAVSLSRMLTGKSPAIGDNPIHVVMLPGESHVNRARNKLAKMFLKTDCTHMLFVDSDIVFTAAHIDALLEHDVDIVGGLYPKKEVGVPQWVVNPLEGQDKPNAAGLIEVLYAGTGFMMIARGVFDRMIAGFDDIEYQDDSTGKLGTMHNFFHAGIRDGRWLSEDWWFCQVWRDLGGKIFADARVQLGHTGSIDYPVMPKPVEMEIKA
jgi:hypothetical protein